MKETIYYDEVCTPKQMRIVSERLCLDHTFTVDASETCIGFDDITELIQSRLIDRVFIFFNEGSAYLRNIDGSLLSLQGWYPVKTDDIELKRISEHYYMPTGKNSKLFRASLTFTRRFESGPSYQRHTVRCSLYGVFR